MTETTEDGFLDGRLRVRQPKGGYRAGMDPVLLAASVSAEPGERVLELGCGVGVALLCLMHRVPDLVATGVELQSHLAELAAQNASANGFDLRVVVADLAAMPGELRAESFDHVLANPPFFDRAHGSVAENASREAGRGEMTDLSVWIDVATRRLVPGGRLWMIQRVSRLPDLLAACDARLGDLRVLPLAARRRREPETVILSAKKGARGAFRLLPPVVMHDGDGHVDGDQHSEIARSVLREGKGLPFGDSV